jgi:hypothetical protein
METKQDHKTRSIEYTHMTCLWIVQIHCIYVHVMGIFALFLFFSQASLSLSLSLSCYIHKHNYIQKHNKI